MFEKIKHSNGFPHTSCYKTYKVNIQQCKHRNPSSFLLFPLACSVEYSVVFIFKLWP